MLFSMLRAAAHAIIQRWLPRWGQSLEEDLVRASDEALTGDKHEAMRLLRAVLKRAPQNVEALNNLSFLLDDLGDQAESRRLFDLAYALDDTYLPVMVNKAKMLVDQRKGVAGLELMIRIKLLDPQYWPLYGVYQSYLFHQGRPQDAMVFLQRAWMANFDNLRYANARLFSISYCDIDESVIASEHRFWAETLPPLPLLKSASDQNADRVESLQGRKIRIGYLSPDFRNHSVRYFFRPLLDNHDGERFEITLYHDAPGRDDQTDLMQQRADHFFDVSKLADTELRLLLNSHRLDILVELSGHTSYNRMHLMQERFATVQISALGYPPTTGLSTIDYKVLDPHILTPNHARYYSETPLVLPSSFWCFDPMTEGLDVAEEPPQFKNGYVTFYSVGNISKINERMLLTWKRIMDRLPTSRLQIRSISFDDDQTQKDFAQRLRSHGFEMGRVSLLKSAIALDLFLSYNEVDIVLDTFPFNGGTTTAFAMHMGTPVITLAGASLVSRMGASAMANMEAAEWICHTFGEYEEKAIVMAANKPFLKEFKQNARGRLNACSMGNGRLYARDFEAACMQALKAQMDEPAIKVCSIAPLPLQELSKRAYATLSNNLIDATRRIQRLISRDYPDSYVVSMLTAQLEIEAGDIEGALERLRMRIDSLDAPGQAAAGLFAAAWYQRGGRIQDMNEVLAVLEPTAIDNNLDRAQFNLFKVCAEQAEDGPLTTGSHYVEPSAQKWVFILVCASEIVYESRRAALMHLWDAWTGLAEAEFVWASRMSRAQTYSAALGREEVDVVVILDETAMPHAPDFPQRINSVLGEHDVVGFFGSSVWHRSMWRYETFDAKVGSYMCKPAPEAEVAELRWFGVAKNSMHPKLAVLDGRLLALRPGSVLGLCPNPAYQGTESLMEEEWVYRAGRQGARLGVAPALGVWLDAPSVSDRTEKVEVFLQLTAEHEFQVFSERPDDAYSANLLITSKAQGLDLQRRITERS